MSRRRGRVARAVPVALALPALLAFAAPPATPPRDAPHVSGLYETTTSEITLIEIWAQDGDGRAVGDLAVGDLTLFVDTHRRPIASFEPVLAGPAAPRSGAAPVPEAPAPGPGLEAARARRTILFFNDALSKAGGMTMARRAAMEFVTQGGVPGDQFAIAASEEHRRLRLIQGFTDDRELVTAALQRSLADPTRVSSLVLEMERPPSNEAAAHGIGPAAPASPMETMPGAMAQVRSSGRTMIRGLEALIEMLAPYRGPKSVVFFGDGLYGVSRLEIEEVTRSAAAAQVTIHAGNTAGIVAGTADMEVAAASRAASNLATFADETGGLRTLSNDPAKLFRAMAAAAGGAYVLSFVPEGPADGRSHSVRLECARKDVTLRYRRVFLRETPEAARARRLEAAFIAPGLHAGFGLDVMTPVRPGSRDLVLYVPADRLLFVPSETGAAAQIEIGAVALDGTGRELARLSRRMQIRVGADDAARRHAPINLLVRGAVPAGAHSVTAVLSDLVSGALGAARLEPAAESHVEGLAGLAIGNPGERSLWVEVPAGEAGTPAPAARPAFSGARRTAFLTSERPACEVRLAASRAEGLHGLRLVLADERTTLLIQPLEGAETAPDRGLLLRARLTLADLEPGDFVLRVEEMRPGGPFVLGRTPLRIAAAASGEPGAAR